MENMDITEIDIDELPELETEIGIFGSTAQNEVGGQACVHIALIMNTGG